MKKILYPFLFINFVTGSSFSQSSPTTLDVVNWNVEWFGSPSNGPADDDLQETNVKTILNWLNADLYGLVEMVDTMRLRRVVDFLGNTEYGFAISPYCSGNTTGTGNGWLTGQKLAFIYRKSVFSNINIRGVMRNSPTGYTNWASGRFPYMFSAIATINGTSKAINFILIHGKSGSNQDDYLKRAGACSELKDTLDTYFSSANSLIIGDYNDALHTTIFPGSGVSSYSAIVSDSIDADHYKSITLPLGAAGQTSMINFPNVIDNQIISNEMEQYYIAASAQIKTDVTTVVPDFVSAHNTSDHYPVFSKYNLAGVVTGITNITANELGIKVYPNPFTQLINIKANKTISNMKIRMINPLGQVISEQSYGLITAGSAVQPNLPPASFGVFFLQVETGHYKTTVKLIRM